MPQTVITYLQMTQREALRPATMVDASFIVSEPPEPDWRLNRSLYRLVGAPWSWTDKLPWTDEEWSRYVCTDTLRTFIATSRGRTAGYYELRRDAALDVEIAIFGLAPDFIGRCLGGALLTHALRTAWDWDARRVWLHTCTLDHPAALANYQARGMTIYDRKPSGAR